MKHEETRQKETLFEYRKLWKKLIFVRSAHVMQICLEQARYYLKILFAHVWEKELCIEKKFRTIDTVPNFLFLSCESIFKPEFRNKQVKHKFEKLKSQMIFQASNFKRTLQMHQILHSQYSSWIIIGKATYTLQLLYHYSFWLWTFCPKFLFSREILIQININPIAIFLYLNNCKRNWLRTKWLLSIETHQLPWH